MAGERTSQINFAAFSDTHFGHDDPQYPSIEQVADIAHEVQAGGIHLLALVGDITDHDSPDEAAAMGKVLTSQYQGLIFAVGGNHDSRTTLDVFREFGIHVLDGEGEVITVQGFRVGVFGQNGSVRRDVNDLVKHLPWTDRAPVLHRETEDMYFETAKRQLNNLVREGIDILLVLSHVYLYPGQISDTVVHPITYEMTPKIMELIERLPVKLKIVVGGHMHSFKKPEIGRSIPFTRLESGTVIGNVAYPNIRRSHDQQGCLFGFLDIHYSSEGDLIATYAE